MSDVTTLATLMRNFGQSVLPLSKVMCAPYSIPVGIINQSGYVSIDFCYASDDSGLYQEPKSEDINKQSTSNTVFRLPMSISQPEIKSVNNTSIITQQLLKTMNKNVQVSTVEVRSQNTANLISNFSNQDLVTSDGEVYSGINNAERLSSLTEERNGNKYAIFHCAPRVQQITNIKIFDFTSTIQNDLEEMYNDIEAHVENELKANGTPDGGIQAMLQNNIKIKASLKENMERIMIQSNQQNINIAQGLTYIDRYGYCDNTGERSQGKLLKQTIDIQVIAVNIINSTVRQMMNNDIDVSSKSSVVIDRVQNYRIIFFSLIWNVCCIYMIYRLIRKAFKI
jgi:RNA polymerase-binding transcription factor DksA